MNKFLIIILILIIFSFLITASVSAQNFKVALVSDIGGFEDGSYNQEIKNALEEAEAEFNFELETKESELMSGYLNNINNFAERNFDLIWTVGFTMEQAVKDAAQMYPDINFVIYDAEAALENVLSITFSEAEGAFLAGVAAALQSKRSTLAFIGGKNNSIIRKYEAGFKAGVKAVNSEIEVLNRYVGSFNNYAAAKEITEELHAAGVDTIFYAAGASGKAIIDTAVNNDIKLISTDPRDTKLASDNLITTILKNTSDIVKNTTAKIISDNYVNEIKEYGLADNAFIIDQKQARKMMSPEIINKVEEYKQQYIAGEIEIEEIE